MKEYPKIQSIFKRDEKTHKFIIGKYSLSEFEYLEDNVWVWTEKINGTNIRVDWDCGKTNALALSMLFFGGKTDRAQIPPKLDKRLHEIFTIEKFKPLYPDTSMTLYGEGYGAGIQKGGGNYIHDGCDFILFDVLIDGWWLGRENMEDIAEKLGIKVVPIIGEGTLEDAVEYTKSGVDSIFGNFDMEGIVLKPKVEIRNRSGHRIITKMKTKDFGQEVK